MIEDARFDVERFLRNCEARRAAQRPPRNRIAWENRPKLEGTIINLTPVGGGPLLPRRVGESDGLHPTEENLVRVSPFCHCLAFVFLPQL